MRSRLLALCLCLGAVVPATAAGQPTDRSQLERARQRVAEIARDVAAAETEVGTTAVGRAEADRQLQQLEDAVNQAAAAVERQERAAVEAAGKLAELGQRLAELERDLGRRAAEVYKSGSGRSLQVMLTAADVQAAVDRGAFLRVITAGDRTTLEDVRNGQVALRAQQRRSDAERDRLLAMERQQEQLLADVAALRDRRALAAAEARRRLTGLQRQRDALEADVERIATLIRERKITPVSSSLPSTAGYLWPRCDEVTSGFGRRWGRLHAGLDINGRTGDYVAAAKAGVVIFAGRQSGYGQLLLVEHPDGVVTAYAHLSRIHVERGRSVDRGERIGDVGSTGRSTGPHLHFETRVNGSPVDPRRFLPRGC